MDTGGGKSVPSRAEDLPDFESFLAEVGQGHVLSLMAGGGRAVGAAAEPDVPVVPPRHVERDDERPGGFAWTGAAVGAAMLLGLLAVWTPLWSGLTSGPREDGARDASASYEASPFFSVGAFHAIRVGMTPGEVRDLIGLPQARLGASGKTEWIYAAPEAGLDAGFNVYAVTFEGGRVVCSRESACEAHEEVATALPQPVQQTGLLQLIGKDGVSHMLPWAQPTPWILLGPEAAEDVPLKAASWARVHAPDAGTSDARPDSHALVSPRRGWLEVPALSVYCAGALYALPVHLAGAPRDALRDDLEWLLARVGS